MAKMAYDLASYAVFALVIAEILLWGFDLESSLSKRGMAALFLFNLAAVAAIHFLPVQNDLPEYVLMGISVCIAFRESALRSFGIYTIGCLCICQLKLYFVLMGTPLSHKTGIRVSYQLFSCLVYLCILALFSAYFAYFRKKWRLDIRGAGHSGYRYFFIIELFILAVNAALITGCYIFVRNNEDIDADLVYNAMAYVLSFVLVLAGFFVSQIILQNIRCREAIRMNERLAAQQRIYCENMAAYQEGVKKIGHDMRHHLVAIRALAAENEWEDAMDYIDGLLSRISPREEAPLSGNIVIDAILSDYKKTMDEGNVKVDLRGKYPKDLKIDDYGLSVIFSNLLLNAIEACAALGEGREARICIEIKSYGRFLYISIENPYEALLPGLRTTKQNRGAHGIGLQNVRQCVKDNNGTLEVEHDNGRFRVSVMLQGDYDGEESP